MSVYQVGDQVEIDEYARVPGNFQPRWIQVEINNITYDIRNNNTGREVLRKTRNQIRRPGQVVGDNDAVYQNGEQVEALISRNWVPATIISRRYHFADGYGDYRDNILMRRPGEDEHAQENPLDRQLTEAEREDFMAIFNIMPQAVRPQLLASLEVGTVRAARDAIEAVLARNGPRRAPQPEPQLPQGLAYEVHNAFAELDLPKFMTVVRRENNGASNFKDNNNILEPVISYINGPDTSLSPEQKTRYTRNIRGSIRQNVNEYIRDHPELKADTLEVIQFVLSQEPNYKDLYIETFENECMGGYSSGNRQSCTKGMFERIYMANKGTIEGLCFEELQGTSTAATSTAAAASAAASSCKPMYLELYSTFTPGADIDINDIFQKWYNQFSYDAIPEETNPIKNLSVASRKQHFRNFVRQDEAISPRIWNNGEFQRKLEQSIQANNIIFETLSLDAGLGRRKRRRHSKKRPVKHVRKTIKKQRKETMKRLKGNIMKGKRKTKSKY
jgi:hypothetical protein